MIHNFTFLSLSIKIGDWLLSAQQPISKCGVCSVWSKNFHLRLKCRSLPRCLWTTVLPDKAFTKAITENRIWPLLLLETIHKPEWARPNSGDYFWGEFSDWKITITLFIDKQVLYESKVLLSTDGVSDYTHEKTSRKTKHPFLPQNQFFSWEITWALSLLLQYFDIGKVSEHWLGNQLGWKLEGTTLGHLDQPPCSSTVILEHMA